MMIFRSFSRGYCIMDIAKPQMLHDNFLNLFKDDHYISNMYVYIHTEAHVYSCLKKIFFHIMTI